MVNYNDFVKERSMVVKTLSKMIALLYVAFTRKERFMSILKHR